MAADTDDLVLSISADIRQMQRALQRMQSDTNTSTRAVERRFDDMSKRSQRSVERLSAGIKGSLRAGLAGFAAGVSVDGAQRLIDTATRIQNALKTAGLEGEQLTKVYDKLFASAQKNSVPIESMVELYSRLSLAQKELGVDTDQLLSFTDKIGQALRVSGKSASEASGALLQLSQALGGGIVRAEEFNSVLEGAPAIVQAVAAGLTEAGGSVSKLRSLVNDGKVSSQAFFKAFEAGAATLGDKLANSEQTISSSFVRLQNVLVDVATRFDDSTDASRHLSNFLNGPLTDAITEIGNLFTGLGEGPIADFIGWVNKAVEATIQGAADIGAATGADRIGAAFGAKPFIGPTRIQNRIDDAFGAGASPKGGQGDRLGAPGGKPLEVKVTNPNSVVKPISLNDYPVEAGAIGGSSAGGKQVENSFNKFNDAVDRFVDNVVKAESGGIANAKNPNSSATGLGQFIESTWLDLFKKNFPDRAASMSNATILALRSDAEISRDLIRAYATENANILRQAGLSVNEAALQLAHFLGPQGAVAVLSAPSGTPVSSVLGASAIKANPSILGGGATTDDVIAYAQRRASANAEVSGSLDGIASSSDNAAAATENLTSSYDVFGSIAQTALDGIKNALADGKIEGKELLGILFDIVQQLLTMPKAGGGSGLFGGGGGGGLLGGTIIPGILHKGGVAGRDGYGHGRRVPPGVFAGATRYHKGGVAGLRPGEVPAILQKGEIITPKGGGRGRSNDTVNIVLQDDSGRMAQIADQQIVSKSGTIVNVAVKRSTDSVLPTVAKYQNQRAGSDYRT
jgi:tape measure domain-containing protein